MTRALDTVDWDDALSRWATKCGRMADALVEHAQRAPLPLVTVRCGIDSLTATGATVAEARAAIYARIMKLIPMADVLELSLARIDRRRRREEEAANEARAAREREVHEPARDER